MAFLRSILPTILALPSLCAAAPRFSDLNNTASYSNLYHSTGDAALPDSYWASRAERPLLKRGLPAGLKLTVLPIGDSITLGAYSSDGNGYRLWLHNFIKDGGHDVDFIGKWTHGDNNPDNQEEGFGGWHIKDIAAQVKTDGVLAEQPNVVLIHAGTNDNWANLPGETYVGAPDRLGSMIDMVVCEDPSAVVLVAMLIENTTNQTQTDYFNSRVPDVVAQRYQKGYKVRVVDMRSVAGHALKNDALHPNDAGYERMAYLWYAAILGIPDDWWAAKSAAPIKATVETCRQGKNYFTAALSGDNLVASGIHVAGDPAEPPAAPGNTFIPQWGDHGSVAYGVGRAGSGVIMADLDGDGKADYLWVDSSDCSLSAWLQKGENNFQPVHGGDKIAFGAGKPGYVEFPDLTGDGKADYVIVVDGSFKVYINNGPLGDVWAWGNADDAAAQLNYIWQGQPVGYHLFGDLNGDGKADVVVINSNGVLDIYYQQGDINGGNFAWIPCRNQGVLIGTKIFMVDIDGDGRADYVSMNADGGLQGWLNKPGKDCGIVWESINGGCEECLFVVSADPHKVRLADFDGDGKADYMVVADDTAAVSLRTNIGKKVPEQSTPIGGYGAAVRLADINGDGKDDYLSVDAKTEVLASLNEGATDSNGWNWVLQNGGGVVAVGVTGATRHQVHFADMNGDGLDDYLTVDDDNGLVRCWLNAGQSGSVWNWVYQDVIFIGIGKPGKGVRFADMNGDGRADWLWLDDNGAAIVYINDGPGNDFTHWHVLNNGAVAALGVGAYEIDVQFADIDGDGLADYIWVHPDSTVSVHYNGGPLGDALGWIDGGQIADGVGTRGQNIRFARIGKSGRADYVQIEEDTGAIKVWLNECAELIGTSGGHFDDSTCGTPPRPPQSEPEPKPGPRCTGDPAPIGCVASMPIPECPDVTNYNSIDDVINDGGLDEACFNRCMMNALSVTMSGALSDYNNIMANDYATKFKYFSHLVYNTAFDSWTDLFQNHPDDFWNCIETDDGKNSSVSCTKPPSGSNFYFILKDPDDFCSAIDQQYNLDCSWLKNITGTYNEDTTTKACASGFDCKTGEWTIPELDPDFTIPDPSKTISAGLDTLTSFSGFLSDSVNAAQLDWFTESDSDAVQGGAPLVLSIQAASQAMQQVAVTGAAEEKLEQKEKIIGFLTGFLLLIPGIGEIAGAASWVTRLARLADYTGNTALSLYQVVEDPSSAPEAIAGLLLGAGRGVRGNSAWTKAGARSRAAEWRVIKALGDDVYKNMGKVRQFCRECKEI